MPDSPGKGGDGKATGVGASVRTNGEAARENSGSTGVSRGVVGGSSLLTERGWYPAVAQLQPSLKRSLGDPQLPGMNLPSLALPGKRGGEVLPVESPSLTSPAGGEGKTDALLCALAGPSVAMASSASPTPASNPHLFHLSAQHDRLQVRHQGHRRR